MVKMKDLRCVVSLENQPGMKQLHQVVVPLMDLLLDCWAQAESSSVRYAWGCPTESCAVFDAMAKTFWRCVSKFDSYNEQKV
jgi:hypothetical protein